MANFQEPTLSRTEFPTEYDQEFAIELVNHIEDSFDEVYDMEIVVDSFVQPTGEFIETTVIELMDGTQVSLPDDGLSEDGDYFYFDIVPGSGPKRGHNINVEGVVENLISSNPGTVVDEVLFHADLNL